MNQNHFFLKNFYLQITGLLVVAVFLLGLLNLITIDDAAHGEGGKMDRIKDLGAQEWERIKDPALKVVPVERLLDAADYTKNLLFSRRGTTQPEWEEHGPNAVGGRTRAIIFDLNDEGGNTVWAGGVAGGLWHSTTFFDSLPQWQPVNDFFENIAISSIVQHPDFPDTMYFGTGEGWFNFDAVRGLGIWRTTDGGNSWSLLPSTLDSAFYHIQKLLIDKEGNLLAATRHSGIMRSVDGGLSWHQTLGTGVGQIAHNRAADLEMGADGSLFATFGILNQGFLFRSDYEIHGEATGDPGTWEEITPPGLFQRMEIACAPSHSDWIYAMGQSPDNYQVSGLFVSQDKGNTWASLPIPNLGSQSWYNMVAAVHPLYEEKVYVGGVFSYFSDNGGLSWKGLNLGHVDHHNIQFNPSNPDVAVWATDGGLYVTMGLQEPVPVFIDKNSGYRVTQFYSCAMHPSADKFEFLGGTQDNGTHLFSKQGLNETEEVTGGDGAFCHIDQDNPLLQISSFVRNQYRITTDGWTTKKAVNFSFSEGWFINPTDYDNDEDILYAANEAGQYRRWLDVASCQENTCSDVVWVNAFGSGKVTHLAVDSHVPGRIFAGLNNGRIVRIDEAAEGLQKSGVWLNENASMPGAWVSCIAQSPVDADHLIVTYSNYGIESVWESIDGGQNWINIEGNLPDMPIRWATFAPESNQTVLLATELGVWMTDKLAGVSTFWQPTSVNLANTRVDMLQLRTSDNNILAATHGRGMFSTSFFEARTIGWGKDMYPASEDEISPDTFICGMAGAIIQLPVVLSRPSAFPFQIKVKTDSASTAVQGRDYQLLDSLIMVPASNPDTLKVRLFLPEDANTEDSALIVLQIFSSDSIYQVSEEKKELSVVFFGDNDPDPFSLEVTRDLSVGYDSLEEFYAPFRGDYSDMRAQILYRKDELESAGLRQGKIVSIGFFVKEVRSTQPYRDFSIRMKGTNQYAVNGSFEDDMQLVYHHDYEVRAGLNLLELDSSFFWDGQQSLVVEICFDNDFGTKSDIVLATATDYYSVQYRRENFGSGCNFLFPSTIYDQRPNLYIRSYQGVEVETVADEGASIREWPGLINHVYSNSHRITVSVELPDSALENCGEGRIATSGDSILYPDWLLGYGMSEKTFHITGDMSLNGRLVDLYFSEKELIKWGQEESQLGIIASLLPFEQIPEGDFTIIPSTDIYIDTFGYEKNRRFRFRAKGPYSYFGLTNAALYALSQTNLYLTAEENVEGWRLSWGGQYHESPQKQELWRWFEGGDSICLASLGAGDPSFYQDKDLEPAGWRYYQVQLTFPDGRRLASQKVAVNSQFIKIKPAIYPNPTAGTLYLSWDQFTADNQDVSIIDMNGNTIWKGIWEGGTGKMTINTENWTSGVYFIELFKRSQRIGVFKFFVP